MIFLNHYKFKVQLAAIVGASALFFNSQAKADGVILVKDYPNQSVHGWKTFSFRTIESFTNSYTVTLTTGRQQVFTTDRVGAIYQEPKWGELILTSDAHWQGLNLEKSKFVALAVQFPQLKEWAQTINSKFDSYLTQKSPSTVIYRGRPLSIEDYNKLTGIDSPNNSGKLEKSILPALTIGSVTLTNVKLKSFNETRISLVHSNGIAGYNFADLEESEISSLSRSFPEFAEHVEKLAKENVPEMQIGKEPQQQRTTTDSAKDSNNEQDDSMAHQAFFEKSELLTEQFKIFKKTLDDPNEANLEAIKSSDLDTKLKSAITQFLETYLSDIARLSEEKPTKNLSYVSFTVIKKLDPKDFDILAGLTGGIYEIAIENVREHAILKTHSTTFTSAGIAEMKVVFMKEVDVKLTNGFSTKTSVIEEAPDDLVAAWDRHLVKNSEIEKRFTQFGETISAELLLTIAGNKFMGLMVEPKILVSNELKSLAYIGNIQSPKLEILREFLNAKDWKRVYTGILTGNLIHSKDGNKALRPNTEEFIPKSLQDIESAVQRLQDASWPLVVQSSSHKGVVMQGQFCLNKKYVKGSNVFIDGAKICLLSIPNDAAGVIPHKVTRSDIEKRGLNFRSPVLTEFYRECTEPHPDQNGVVEWVKFGGTDYVLFSDRGDKTNDFREMFRIKISDQIDTLNEQLLGEQKRYELSQNADQIEVNIGALLSKFYQRNMEEAQRNY